MAAAAGEQKELLALMHKHLVQIGYEKAAKELLRQSGQKNFPSPSVPLEDIFIQWKKASFQAQKRKGDDIKTDIPSKIRIPDPKSSSETSEEEDVASPVKTNLPVNSSSTAKAESSSEDEDSSSEEDVVSGKIVKPIVTGNQTAKPLQLAAQKANSVPGKGVAIASVQAKERPNKANSNKPSPLLVGKAGQNKVISGKPEAASPSQILKGQSTAPVSIAQKAAASESSSSSSESEEEKTSTAVKTPAPQPALKKTESSSEDSSEDSDSEEEESNTATVQIKPAVQHPQVSAMPVKSCPTPVTSSKGSTVKVSQAFKGQSKTPVSIAQKVAVSETSSSSSESEEEKTSTTIKVPIPKPALKKTESSSEDSSEDSDSEEEEEESKAATIQVKPAVQSPQISATSVKSSPVTVASSKGSTVKASLAKTKAKSSEKTPQTSAASVKSALPNLLSSKAASTPSPLKQTSKPSVPSLVKPALLPPAKVAGSAESSESSESSSESEDEVPPVPVSQKRLQTAQPPSGVKSNPAAKPGTPVKAPSSALKKEETESESSSSSDSEDETVPAAQNLPPPSATKSNAAAQLTHAKAASSAPAPLKASQQSEDSSQDSSDESDTEEDTVFTQKSSLVAHKPLVTPIRALTAKTTGVASGKACSVQSAGKTTVNMESLATASLQKSSESSETDSSDSSESEEDEKPAKQKVSPQKAATLSRKIAQVNTVTPNSNSNKCQGKNPSTTLGKVELSSAKPSQSQTSLTKPAETLKHKENATSSSSSDSKEEEGLDLTLPFATSTQILQPGTAQKQTTREADSSSEESSDEELEPSQSLLAGHPGRSKPPIATVQKNIASKQSKQGSGKTTFTTGTPACPCKALANALAKPSEKMGPADISSSDSSTSDSDAEEIPAGPKAETGAVPFSAKGALVAKMSKATRTGKTEPAAITSKDISAKKTSAKSERNGKAKGNAAIQLSLIPHTENGDKAVAQGPGAGAQGDIKTSSVVVVKTPKTAKSSKADVKEKQKKKRKLAAGETGLKEPKRKKQKGQAGSEEGEKKKKKKSKSKSKGKVPKEKDGKEKKSKSKKGKKKMPSSVTSDGSLLLKKKKKKKKKTSDLEGAV